MTTFSENKFWKKIFKQAKATGYQVVKKVLLIFYAFVLSFAAFSCSNDEIPPTGPASMGKANSRASASGDQPDIPVVRFFYFYSNKHPFRAEMLAAIKAGILRIQAVYAEQMETLGHSPLFRFEIDAQGDPVVELVADQNSDALPHNEVWELVSDATGEPKGINYVFYEADQPEGITIYYAKNKGLGYHGERWEVWAGDNIWEEVVAGSQSLAYLLPDSRDSGSAVETPDSVPDSEGVGVSEGNPNSPVVRFFYFYSNRHPFRAEMLAAIKSGILRIQAVYAEQMETLGHSPLFRFEIDAQGDPVVELVADQNSDGRPYDEVTGEKGINYVFYEADQPDGIVRKGLGYHGERLEVWKDNAIWEGSVAGPHGLAFLLPDSRDIVDDSTDQTLDSETPNSGTPDSSLGLLGFLGSGIHQATPDNSSNAGLDGLPSRDLFELGGSFVQFIYFYSADYPFSAAVLESMKIGILRIQAFYAEQMQAHGYGYRTFRFETDEQGDPVVNLVEDRNGNGEDDEVRELFMINATTGGIEGIYSIFYEDGSGRSRGIANSYGKNAGLAYVQGQWDWETAAHELGHLFGLLHDFRDDSYLMSYGRNRHALSACSAEFLAVNPYLNADIPLEEGSSPTVELISPATYPVGSESVSVQIKVRDPEGIHQVFFLTGDIYSKKVKACRGLAGEKEAIVEFEYDGKRFSSDTRNLSDPVVHPIRFYAVDLEGNWGGLHEDFSLMQR